MAGRPIVVRFDVKNIPTDEPVLVKADGEWRGKEISDPVPEKTTAWMDAEEVAYGMCVTGSPEHYR